MKTVLGVLCVVIACALGLHILGRAIGLLLEAAITAGLFWLGIRLLGPELDKIKEQDNTNAS